MAHDHHHGHHDHGHNITQDADRRYLWVALLLLLGFMGVEVIAGLLAHSLALITDAGHMLTDAGAIGLSLAAMHLAARPARGRFTFGFKRIEILSAQANGITLLLLSAWFIIEAVLRLIHPPEVEGVLVTIVAIVGIGINLLAVWSMSKANRQSLNVEGSFQHILTDLYAFIATAIAGIIIWATGWSRVDALAALIVAWLMLKAGLGLVKESGRIFLEAAPPDQDPERIETAMRQIAHVTGIVDLHVWEVTSGMTALSAQIYVERGVDCHDVRRTMEAMLSDEFAITHTTLQTDHGEPPLDSAFCQLGEVE